MDNSITYTREEIEQSIASLASGINYSRKMYISTGNKSWRESAIKETGRMEYLTALLKDNQEEKEFRL